MVGYCKEKQLSLAQMSPVVLRELDGNRRSINMSEEALNKCQAESEGIKCFLPIPFVKGSPIDYQRMNVDQLRRFIAFMYRCQYKVGLPNSPNGSTKPPAWWPATVSFEKNLRLKASSSHKGAQGQLKELTNLIRRCYESAGFATLLALGNVLSTTDSGYRLLRANADCWKVVDDDGRAVALVDKASQTYDATPRERKVFVERECQENLEAMHHQNKMKQQSKSLKTNYNSKSVKKQVGSKRKHFEMEELEESLFNCKYCRKDFKGADFRDEHQLQCVKGPFTKSLTSELNFMSALGLDVTGRSQKIKTRSSFPPNEPTNSSSRNLRKLPKRNRLLSLLRNNPIPLTSFRGQRFYEELGEKVQHRYPPAFEKYCQPNSGLPMSEKEYPSVTKRAILKHADFPHIYTRGRRQRVARQQELGVGLNRTCWKTLNSLKRAKLRLKKIKPTMKKLVIPSSTKRTTSYLERKWRGAIVFPRICLVDFKKNMTDEIRQYVPPKIVGSPKPGTSKSYV